MSRRTRASAPALLLAALLLAGLPGHARAAAPFFSGIGDLPGGPVQSFATDVSNTGVVIGGGASCFSCIEGILWTRSGGLEPTGWTSLWGISADGSVVLASAPGGFWLDADGEAPVPVPLLDVRGLSADGTTVVGYREHALVSGVLTTEAARWTEAGGVEGLGFLPHTNLRSQAFDVSRDGSVVAGTAHNNDLAPGFRWTADTGMQPMDSIDPQAYASGRVLAAISGSGEKIAGFADFEGYVWSEATGYTPLGNTFSVGIPKIPRDMDHVGSRIVGGNSAAGSSAAFLWDPVNGMRELSSVLRNVYGLDLTGWTLLDAYGISPSGRWIVGQGINPNGDREGWAAFLGSPGCGLGAEVALVLGLLTPLWRRRHRRV